MNLELLGFLLFPTNTEQGGNDLGQEDYVVEM